MTSRNGRITTFLRVTCNSTKLYSNETKITPFCRAFRAQRNDIFRVYASQTTQKLQALEILDIYAWVHYTCTSIHNHYTWVHIIHRTCPTSVHVHKSPDPISMYIYTCLVLKARVAQEYVKSPFLRCIYTSEVYSTGEISQNKLLTCRCLSGLRTCIYMYTYT